jgi:hypothetical protein
MRTTPLLVTTLLLATLATLAPGATAWRCVAAEDQTATTLGVGVETYYNRLYQHTSYHVEELWQETNGEEGLQTSAGMSCVGSADRLVDSACIGVCPLRA